MIKPGSEVEVIAWPSYNNQARVISIAKPQQGKRGNINIAFYSWIDDAFASTSHDHGFYFTASELREITK